MNMEQQYRVLGQDILVNGDYQMDRTNVGTWSVFGRQLRCDLSKEFPLFTARKMYYKSGLGELLFFIEGSQDERRLAEITYGTRDPERRTIWTDNAEAPYWKPKAKFPGDIGRIYGVQWRDWKKFTITHSNNSVTHVDGGTTHFDAKVVETSVDQLEQVVQAIKNNPSDRRMIISAWNPSEMDNMSLPPCHCFAQFYVAKGKLSCQFYMRSVDYFLGMPTDIISYAFLTHMLAQVTSLEVGELIMTTGNTHIYKNSLEETKELISRKPFPAPKLVLNPDVKNINDFKMEDFTIVGYQSHAPIKVQMAV